MSVLYKFPQSINKSGDIFVSSQSNKNLLNVINSLIFFNTSETNSGNLSLNFSETSSFKHSISNAEKLSIEINSNNSISIRNLISNTNNLSLEINFSNTSNFVNRISNTNLITLNVSGYECQDIRSINSITLKEQFVIDGKDVLSNRNIPIFVKINNEWKQAEQLFVKMNNEWKIGEINFNLNNTWRSYD